MTKKNSTVSVLFFVLWVYQQIDVLSCRNSSFFKLLLRNPFQKERIAEQLITVALKISCVSNDQIDYRKRFKVLCRK